MTRNFLIPKEDKDKIYQIIHDKNIMGLHGGIIGDYRGECVITFLDKWIPYLDEYGVKHREVKIYFNKDYGVEYE